MKHFAYIIAAAVLAAACGKEAAEPEQSGLNNTEPAVEQPHYGEGTLVSIQAGIVREGDDSSRASVDSGTGTMSWEAGDAIAVWTGSAFTEFTIDPATIGDEYPTFNAVLTEGQEVGELAVYPYSASHTYNSGTDALGIALPASYDTYSGSDTRAVMVAKGTSTVTTGASTSVKEFHFKHFGASVMLTIKDMNGAASAITATLPGKKLSGTYNVTLASATEIALEANSTDDEQTVSFTLPDIASRTSSMVFYLPVPTGSLSGLQVKAVTSGGAVLATATLGAGYAAARGDLLAFSGKSAISIKVLGGGMGTEASPLLISSKEDLVALSDYTNTAESQDAFRGLYYQQTANIAFDGVETFNPISQSNTKPFSGTYNGGDMNISNLKVSTSETYSGLFGYVTGTISHLQLVNPVVSGAGDTGAISGWIHTAAIIQYCTVTGATISGTTYVGGIAGYGGKLVDHCSFQGSVSGTADRVGGIIGYGTVTITNCQVQAGSSISSDTSAAGGIIGRAKGVTISGCTINSTALSPTTIQAPTYAGGIIGCAINGASTSISNNTVESTASITSASGSNVGGIVGYHSMGANSTKNAEFNNNISAATVSGSGNIGGIIGYLGGKAGLAIDVNGNVFTGTINASGSSVGGIIANATTVATLTASSNYVSGTINGAGANVGGILGYLEISKATNAFVSKLINNKVVGDITGAYAVGGILGYNKNYTISADSYAHLTILNCAYENGTLTGTAPNGNNFSLIGGIAGWVRGGYEHSIINCYSRPSEINANNQSANSLAIGGILGYEGDYSKPSVVTCVYSTISPSITFKDGVAVDTGTDTYYGGLFGTINESFPCSYLYWNDSITKVSGQTTLTNASNTAALSTTAMTDGTLLANLNAGRAAYNATAESGLEAAEWVAGTGGYPTISGLPTGD